MKCGASVTSSLACAVKRAHLNRLATQWPRLDLDSRTYDHQPVAGQAEVLSGISAAT
jgi:hypothetical protein